MYKPKYELRGWDDFTIEERKISLSSMCEHLITHNMILMRKHPDLLRYPLYEFDGRHGPPLRYILKKRPGDIDDWYDIAQVIEMGGGDCKDFSCWMVAYERCTRAHFDVYPWITDHLYPDPKGAGPDITLYHVRVRLHDHIEDPSVYFGMPSIVSYDELRS